MIAVYRSGSRTILRNSQRLCPCVILTLLWLLAAQPGTALGATLADLFAGAVIEVGDMRFSDWELVSLDAAEDQTPDLTQITVEPLNDDPDQPGVMFLANNQLVTSGLNTLDLVFQYQVTTVVPGRTMVERNLTLTEFSFSQEKGILFVSDELRSPIAGDLGTSLVSVNREFQDLLLASRVEFAPASAIVLTKNLFVTSVPGSGTAAIQQFTERYSVVPEPGSCGLNLAALATGWAFRRHAARRAIV